jgi:hypothetical protein
MNDVSVSNDHFSHKNLIKVELEEEERKRKTKTDRETLRQNGEKEIEHTERQG